MGSIGKTVGFTGSKKKFQGREYKENTPKPLPEQGRRKRRAVIVGNIGT